MPSSNDSRELDEERSQARGWRRIFEEDFHPLALDARVELAGKATEETLYALCYDPSSRVVAALLANPQVGLLHARLIAQHHRSSTGIDELGKRAQLLRDQQVQRYLFRNPQCSDRLLVRLLQTKRMAELYQLSLSRDSTERVRSRMRKELRKKFTSGTAEERVGLILECQGRCLVLLIGVPLDGKAAALLYQRPISSTLLIQNLARWPSTPPSLLQNMARQPSVLRSPVLKNLILRHPNAPAQLKFR